MGLLDEPIQEVVSTVIDILVDNTATLVRTPDPEYDVLSDEEVPLAVVNTSVKVSPPFPYKVHEIDGQSIRRDDLKVLVARRGLSVIPDPKTDTLLFDGTTFEIIATNPFYAGDEVAFWELQLRR